MIPTGVSPVPNVWTVCQSCERTAELSFNYIASSIYHPFFAYLYDIGFLQNV
jgi:hypothetical protein